MTDIFNFEAENIETQWEIDPRTVQRLWPVIDVYGRVARALRAQELQDGGIGRLRAGNGSAA